MSSTTSNDVPAAKLSGGHKRVIFASSLGTVFEWYDFYLYGSLSVIISRQFFSGVNETTAFIFALLAFAAGFFVRPFGALIFGRLGDLIGRKYTFLVTIVIMGLSTALVGMLPSYAQIGVAAPIILISLRLLQGLALGGEYGGAAMYVAVGWIGAVAFMANVLAYVGILELVPDTQAGAQQIEAAGQAILQKAADFNNGFKLMQAITGLWLVTLGMLACRSALLPRAIGVFLVVSGSLNYVGEFMEKVKDKSSNERLMGFGHRVYKNYDPRAAIIKKHADAILRNRAGGNDQLLDIALELEEAALSDPYFVERKLYPNVDFYTGLIYRAMGFPTDMFTVLFAIGRLPGWIAQWREMIKDPTNKIGRPRQIYIGHTERDYVAMDAR